MCLGADGSLMTHNLAFEKLIEYDTSIAGITIDIKLFLGDSSVSLLAKIDTGSDRCIFSRIHGEALGRRLKPGNRSDLERLPDLFSHTDIRSL